MSSGLLSRLTSVTACCSSVRNAGDDASRDERGPRPGRAAAPPRGFGHSHPVSHSGDASVPSASLTARRDQASWVTVVFPFQGRDPQPFPPDPHPDLSVHAGEKLRVFPARSQYGWCLVADARTPARKGWVPGNYVSANGVDPFITTGADLEQRLWARHSQGGRAAPKDLCAMPACCFGAPRDELNGSWNQASAKRGIAKACHNLEADLKAAPANHSQRELAGTSVPSESSEKMRAGVGTLEIRM